MIAARRAAAFLFAAAAFTAAPAAALDPVCPKPAGNPTDSNKRVECTEDGAVHIDLDGYDITGGAGEPAVSAKASRGHDIRIGITGGKIVTKGHAAWGVFGQIVRSKEAGDSNDGNLVVDVRGADIRTNGGSSPPSVGNNAHGIYAQSQVDGDIDIFVENSAILTYGQDAYGIFGDHFGTGRLRIEVRNTGVDTLGTATDSVYNRNSSFGILGGHHGTGDVAIRADGGAEVETAGAGSHGIYAFRWNSVAGQLGGGAIAVRADGGASVATKGAGSHGIYAWNSGTGHHGTGDVAIRADGGAEVETAGAGSHGIYALRWNSVAGQLGGGAIAVRADGGASVATKGADSHGIYAWNSGTGDIGIGVSGGADVTTGGADSHGIYALRWNSVAGQLGGGAIAVRADGGASVTAEGAGSFGILGYQAGTGGIGIAVAGGATVKAANVGVYGLHLGASGDVAIAVTDGATVTAAGHGLYTGISGSGAVSAAVGAGASATASGAGSSGIRFGRFDATTDAIERAANLDAAGVYRKQTAAVHGTVRGGTGDDAAGVYLAGGGRVYIGPQGTVGAASGVSVWARRKLTTGNNPDDPPALYVSLNPGGRRMAAVLDGGWILNDGGKTTIVMNGVKLHDGTAGATGLWAPNGARDVTIRKAGVKVPDTTKVTDTTKPGSFVTVALTGAEDRDFSAADFTEVYAPRAAVYEALPGFLLRLDGGAGPAGTALAGTAPSGTAPSATAGKARTPGSPLWLRIGGGFGRYAARRAAVGARYRFRRWEAEAGMDFRLAEGVTGFASARLASGSARVSAATGGGRIEAAGYGLAAGAQWRGPQGWFAAGRLSAMRYSVDVESATRGRLKGGAGAWVFGYGAEMGKRFAAAGATRFAARAWAGGGQVSLDGFTDAVRARVSAPDGSRLSVGAEAASETVRKLDGGGELALRGAAGLALALDGGTAAEVSGAALRSKAPGARLLLGLGAEWRPRKDDAGTALGFDAEASGAGSRDAAYSLNLTLRTAF